MIFRCDELNRQETRDPASVSEGGRDWALQPARVASDCGKNFLLEAAVTR
jgi:hypothetical protein